MPFQPFGYPFDINYPLSLSDLKKSIRSRSKGWFDMKDGARGWVAGPVVCLWFRAFDRHGPMLLGWISRSPSGTRIAGRAGSDLNGLVLLVAIMPLMVVIVFMMASTGGSRSLERAVITGGVYAVIGVVVLWSKHLLRHEAEPLVRFLRDAATKSNTSRHARPAAGANLLSLVLTVNGEDHGSDATPDTIHEALVGIGPGGFAVLASAPEIYLQTAWRDGDFIIEMRDGDETRHFRAVRSRRSPSSKDRSRSTFTFEEVLAVFVAYASGVPTPVSVTWEK